MKGIVLAAGMGQRLGKLTKNSTKGQVKMGEESLILRLLNQIKETNAFDEVIIVIGHQGQNLKDHISKNFDGLKISFIENTIFDSTNNIYSLFLARHKLTASDCVIFESDLVLADGIINRFVHSGYRNSVMLARYESWMDGTVVELGKNNKIEKFISGKALEYENKSNYYKTVNVYKFSREFSEFHYVPFLDAYIKSFGKNSYYEEVLKIISFLEHTDLTGYTLSTDEAWYEIDDEHDLFNAEAVLGNSTTRLHNITSRFGGYWRFPELKDFCYLVNPYFPSKRLIEEMKGNFEELLREYPSGHYVQSLLAARNFGVDKAKIIVGNGGTELIKAFAESIACKERKKRIGIILPTFEEYWRQFNVEKFDIITLNDNDRFAYEVDDVLHFLGKVDVLIIVNPDNPSGNTLNSQAMKKILEESKLQNKLVLVDESFMDFAESSIYFSLIDDEILDEYPNLFVLKSISKSFGVPGLRLGILLSSHVERLDKVRRNLSIWNINSFAEYYLDIAFKYRNEYKLSRALITDARSRFLNLLKTISWLEVFPSQANYVLCAVTTDILSSSALTELLLNDYNILVKDCAGKLGFDGKSFVRVAVRDDEDNAVIIAALEDISKRFLIQ